MVSLPEKTIFPCPRSRLRIWSRETGSAVPSGASRLILHTHQAESGAYSRVSLLPSAFRDGMHPYRHPPSKIIHIIHLRESVPEFIGSRSYCDRWRSLSRIRRYRGLVVLIQVALVVQLVTSKPSEVGTWVRIPAHSHELRFFLTPCPTSGERLFRTYTKFDFTVDERKGQLYLSREKKLGKNRRRKVEKSCETFLLCDPGWCIQGCSSSGCCISRKTDGRFFSHLRDTNTKYYNSSTRYFHFASV